MTNNPAMTNKVSPGRLESMLLCLLGKEAQVRAVERWSDRFRMVELEGQSLLDSHWAAGQKIQVAVRGMRVARTYTPISWDALIGRTRFLVFAHGQAPGSDWARSLEPGQICQIVGPRRSVTVDRSLTPLVLFGDETAFGLAAAVQLADPARPFAAVFEVGDVVECRQVLALLNMASAALTMRQPDDSHLRAVEDLVNSHAKADTAFVLAGRAQAVQHLHRSLRRLGVKSSQLHTKAYWAPGKIGLD
jgi:ferric-chelate reductase (NADPH)